MHYCIIQSHGILSNPQKGCAVDKEDATKKRRVERSRKYVH